MGLGLLSGTLRRPALRGVFLPWWCPALGDLPNDVHPRAGAGQLGADVDGHLDESLVVSQLLGQASTGHRGRQHRALLQGDGRPAPHRLSRGGQRGLGEGAGRKRADRDVLLGEKRPGTDRARGDKNLLPTFGAGMQHTEGHQDRGSQAESHHQVAMAPQQKRGTTPGPPDQPARTGRACRPGFGREGARRPSSGIVRLPRGAEGGAAGQSMASSHATRVGGRRPPGTPAPWRCGQRAPPASLWPPGVRGVGGLRTPVTWRAPASQQPAGTTPGP